jgi:hypothetical protein
MPTTAFGGYLKFGVALHLTKETSATESEEPQHAALLHWPPVGGRRRVATTTDRGHSLGDREQHRPRQ